MAKGYHPMGKPAMSSIGSACVKNGNGMANGLPDIFRGVIEVKYLNYTAFKSGIL